MQLVAYGAQDIYLTGNPSITFFKIVYRRHTNFATESIEQTFNGTVGYGKKVSCTMSRNGDLVTTAFLEVTMKKGVDKVTAWPCEALLKEVELEIGGQKIDKVYSDWYRIYDELFRTSEEKAAYRRLVDFDDATVAGDDGVVKRFYIPLIFFFNKSPGLALPLIALQYHECKLHFTFASATEMTAEGIDTSEALTATLYCTYVFLDTDERRRFAQVSHEYLITQLQFTGAESIAPGSSKATRNIRLNFNHPTKLLAFAVKDTNGKHGKFTTKNAGESDEKFAPIASAKLQLNGHDRFSERKGSYFNYLQPYEHLKTKPAAGVYLYSFALKPDEHQPSGTCNFSRIDNATLIITTKAGSVAADDYANVKTEDHNVANISSLTNLLVFAENYNVLRVMSGMGGLAYSN